MHNNNTNSENQNKNFGNRCGHRPETPRFLIPPEHHANRPLFLRTTNKATEKFYYDPSLLPLLNAANGSTRQQRSERREGCVVIMQSLIHYTDLITQRVGIPQADGSMAGLTMPFLATMAGLSLRRAERAIRDLVAAGMITVHPICKKISDTVYEGIAAIRTVSTHFFTALGLYDFFKHEQRKAIDRRKKKNLKQDRKKAAQIQMGLNALKNKSKAIDPAADTVQRKGEMSPVSAFFTGARKILNPDTS